MKSIAIIVAVFTGLLSSAISQTKAWSCKDAQISFFSSAPLEDIEAISKLGASAFSTTTGDIVFKVWNSTFQFEKKLMQEHFNENYMESERYPTSEFRGKVLEANKLEKEGSYELEVTGMLNIHGISKQYHTKVQIRSANNILIAKGSFDVRLADHNIKIPTVVGKNIAEVVKVKFEVAYKQ